MTEDGDSKIPIVETYRGVGIHDRQSRARIDREVKPAIDTVAGMTDPEALARYAGDVAHPPEARLYAAARCEAAWQLAAEMRELRPKIDMDRMRASVIGADSLQWRDPRRYGSLLDGHDQQRMVKRERVLDER